METKWSVARFDSGEDSKQVLRISRSKTELVDSLYLVNWGYGTEVAEEYTALLISTFENLIIQKIMR
jgi:hypothetical protein